MNHLSRALIFIGLAVITVVLCQIFPNAASNPEAGVYMQLPENLEGYTSQELEMSELEKHWLPDDTRNVKRIYRPIDVSDTKEKTLGSITANIILSGADHRSLHRPEVCMTAQGWTIDAREVVSINTDGGKLDVMDLHLSKKISAEDGNKFTLKAHYIYWWVGKEVSTPHSWQRVLLSSMNNIFKNVNDRWAYPSVMVIGLDEYEGSEKASRERAIKFIKEYAPTFQISLGAVDNGGG